MLFRDERETWSHRLKEDCKELRDVKHHIEENSTMTGDELMETKVVDEGAAKDGGG